MAAIEAGMVPMAQVLEGLVALYLQTPEENRQVITETMLSVASVKVARVLDLPPLRYHSNSVFTLTFQLVFK